MLFNSFSYPLFLALVIGCYWALPKRLRAMWIICSGILFYCTHDWGYLILIAILTVLTFAAGQMFLKNIHPKLTIAISITALTLVLVFFKYLGLLAGTVEWFTGLPLHIRVFVMPLGISFFTFEFIHYLADIARKQIGEHKPTEFAAFIFFFPTLISGPIKRFGQFRESLANVEWRPNVFFTGVMLMLLGYSQKYIFADPLIAFTTQLEHPEVLLTTFSALGGLVFYSLRIYFDFAGLSNIAIGSALLFGIIVPKNFAYPYLRSNIQDFWRNWHMSLSSWVRDYIYITLGGNRKGTVMTAVNLLIAMAIVGIWHGAAWNFAIWGIYHGLGLVFYVWWKRKGYSLGTSFVSRLLGIAITFVFVTISWAFFVTTSLSDSLLLLSKAFPIF